MTTATNILKSFDEQSVHEEDGSITVVAFSPEHVPFPLSDHPTQTNPLFDDE
ncbi:TPA: hypothetical protein ACX3IP_004097 [Vibrio parahaemolyticus]